jgi:prevent-host-death family protein
MSKVHSVQQQNHGDKSVLIYSVTQAKANLKALLSEIEQGREVMITRRGIPIVKVQAYREPIYKSRKLTQPT